MFGPVAALIKHARGLQMVSGRGDNGSRRGNSLLRLSAEEDTRARAGGTYVTLGTPDTAPGDADIHRRARSRRERVENAYLAELASHPEPQRQQREQVTDGQKPSRRGGRACSISLPELMLQ